MSSFWQAVADTITQTTQQEFRAKQRQNVGGGCINSAYRISDGSRSFFVKLNQADKRAMFEAEFAGLQELAQANAIRVPNPLCVGEQDNQSYLVMEYLELGRATNATSARLGSDLARLHRTRQRRFGWDRDNTIGSTPQINPWEGNWSLFWQHHRLGYQLDLAARKGASRKLIDSGQKLLGSLDCFFRDHRPVPSLLHGDLWGGNWSADRDGTPAIFDPAVYYGDREADIAMTELFGGFSSDFYAAYREAWPIDSGYSERRDLYNLYHILNHFNLFGGGYAGQASHIIDTLLSLIR